MQLSCDYIRRQCMSETYTVYYLWSVFIHSQIQSSRNPDHGSFGCHDGRISNQSTSSVSIPSNTYQCGNVISCPLLNVIIPRWYLLFFSNPRLLPVGLPWKGCFDCVTCPNQVSFRCFATYTSGS